MKKKYICSFPEIIIIANEKNAYTLAALLFAGFKACNYDPTFKVKGEVTDADDKMFYLEADRT